VDFCHQPYQDLPTITGLGEYEGVGVFLNRLDTSRWTTQGVYGYFDGFIPCQGFHDGKIRFWVSFGNSIETSPHYYAVAFDVDLNPELRWGDDGDYYGNRKLRYSTPQHEADARYIVRFVVARLIG
jgi:hypothetical protein